MISLGYSGWFSEKVKRSYFEFSVVFKVLENNNNNIKQVILFPGLEISFHGIMWLGNGWERERSQGFWNSLHLQATSWLWYWRDLKEMGSRVHLTDESRKLCPCPHGNAVGDRGWLCRSLHGPWLEIRQSFTVLLTPSLQSMFCPETGESRHIVENVGNCRVLVIY